MSETIEPLASPATSVPWTPMWPLSPTVPTTVPQAHVYRSTPQNIAHGTVAPLSFDVELYDTDAIHDAVNPTRLTCKTAGTYLIWVVLGWASNATGERQALVYQNGGSTEIGSANQLAVGGNFTKLSFPVIRQLAVGDYVEVNAYQNSGVALDASRAEFAMTMLSPALLPAPGALIPVTYGTTLPTSPVDGQEAVLVDSLTSPNYQWRFRYNAGSSYAYKWEFVGGAPVQAGFAGLAQSQGTATTWAPVAPGLTVPRAGVYQATAEWSAQSLGAAAMDIHGRFSGSSSGAKTDFTLRTSVANNQQDRPVFSEVITLAASEQLSAQSWLSIAQGHNIRDTVLRFVPIRVS